MGLRSGLQGVSISVASYCQVSSRDIESYLGRHPGRRVLTGRKQKKVRKISQMQLERLERNLMPTLPSEVV